MDLTDIFGEQAKPMAAKIADALAETPVPKAPSLHDQAKAAAKTADELAVARVAYEGARARLTAEMEAKLKDSKLAYDQAQSDFDGQSQALQAAMEQAEISKIEMPDRPPIVIKTIPGKKKQITLTWLKDTLGKVPAEELWKRVPKSDDTTDIVIPPPYGDEPNS